MNREQLIKVLYDNWMNNYFKEDQDIISIEKKILDLIQTTSDDPDIQARLLELEGLLGQLTAKCLEDGFHDGFLTQKKKYRIQRKKLYEINHLIS